MSYNVNVIIWSTFGRVGVQMASIKKRGEYQWRVRVEKINRATGLVHKESATHNTKAEAVNWAKGVEAALAEGRYNDTRVIDSTYLRELIERYKKNVSPKKLGSKQEIVRLEKWLKSDLADRIVSRCTARDFADYIEKRRGDVSKRGGHVAEQTIKLEIIAISNVFEIARKDWGYKELENPTRDISKPKGSGMREVRIEPKNWERIADILRKCRNPQYIVIAEFAIETGMRQDELFRMCWKDVDLLGRKVIVEGKDTSTTGQRKKRTVPLSMRAIELLQSLPRSINGSDPVFQVARKTSADGLSRAFTGACKAIGLEGGCFHSTRHEAASRMAPHYPMLTLMKIFGWKTPAMAARYYHASDEELLAGIDRMQQLVAQSA